jgi:PAS domain S-box-containing protein
MSHPLEAVFDQFRILASRVRLLGERSRLTRGESARTQQGADALPGSLSVEAPTREQERVPTIPNHLRTRGARDRRGHDGVGRPGRRESDRRPHVTENRRVLLSGPDEGWRLLAAYMFEEAGYTVYAEANQRQALRSTERLLPDVIVMRIEAPDTLAVPPALGDASTKIPVVVLTSSLHSIEVPRASGAVTLLPHCTDVHELIDEADTLIVTAPRVQRTLQRRLLALKELAQHYRTDAEGQERLRHLIDRLQVAILAVDEAGRCIAASDGATVLTGYSRPQLLTTSMMHDGFAAGHVSDELWRSVLANRPYAGTTTITTREGEDVPVHAAAVAEILPGLHVAAFVAA